MPEELAPLRKWYEAGQAAVVANMSPLVRPITRAEYLAGVGCRRSCIRWMGLSATEVGTVRHGLANFDANALRCI